MSNRIASATAKSFIIMGVVLFFLTLTTEMIFANKNSTRFSCPSSRALNTSANGYDGRANMIRGKYLVARKLGLQRQALGWQYVAYSGATFTQFALAFSDPTAPQKGVAVLGMGPIVKGAFWPAFMSYSKLRHQTQASLPPAYRSLHPRDLITTRCTS